MKLTPVTQVNWTFAKRVAVAMVLAAVPSAGCSSSSSPSSGSPDASNVGNEDAGEGSDATTPTGDGASTSSSDAGSGDGHAPQDAHVDGSDGGPPAGDSPAGATGVAALCSATCNRLATCSGTVVSDASSCSCSASATGSQFYLYRSDYVAAIASCITGETCTQLLADSGSPDCETSALAGITPTAAVASLCMAVGNSTCPGDATTDCPDTFKPYSDMTITALSACIANPTCANHTACLQAALGQ